MEYPEMFVRLDGWVADSPVARENVITDVRDLMTAGEFALAFDTLCSWIHDDGLPVDREYHARLVSASAHLGSGQLVAPIGKRVRGNG